MKSRVGIKITTRFMANLFCIAIVLSATGCGWIADKDRIVIANIDGEPLRRGDLRRIIRDMTDEERPLIQNRGDLLRALNKHIDDTIRAGLAEELLAEDKIANDRKRATAIYFERNPDDRFPYSITDARELGISDGELTAVKAAIEFKIDDIVLEVLAVDAFYYRLRQAAEENLITITDEEYQQEYRFNHDGYVHFERIGFVGLRFPQQVPQAVTEAAKARRRIDAGEAFEEVAQWYASQNPNFVFQSVIENNPNLDRFRSFWQNTTGTAVGTVIGPIFLPEHEVVAQNADGTLQSIKSPPSHVVLKVLEYIPERTKTWEEAKPELQNVILVRKVNQQLREEHGVEIFVENLPDPAGYGKQLEGSFIDTGQ